MTPFPPTRCPALHGKHGLFEKANGKNDRGKDEDDHGDDNEDDATKTMKTRATVPTPKSTAANLPSCGHYCKHPPTVLKPRILSVFSLFFLRNACFDQFSLPNQPTIPLISHLRYLRLTRIFTLRKFLFVRNIDGSNFPKFFIAYGVYGFKRV